MGLVILKDESTDLINVYRIMNLKLLSAIKELLVYAEMCVER